MQEGVGRPKGILITPETQANLGAGRLGMQSARVAHRVSRDGETGRPARLAQCFSTLLRVARASRQSLQAEVFPELHVVPCQPLSPFVSTG